MVVRTKGMVGSVQKDEWLSREGWVAQSKARVKGMGGYVEKYGWLYSVFETRQPSKFIIGGHKQRTGRADIL